MDHRAHRRSCGEGKAIAQRITKAMEQCRDSGAMFLPGCGDAAGPRPPAAPRCHSENLPAPAAFAFFGAAFAQCQQPAQPCIPAAVGRPYEQSGASAKVRRDRPTASIPLRWPPHAAHHAGKGVDIGDCDGAISQLGGPIDQFIGMRCSATEKRSWF